MSFRAVWITRSHFHEAESRRFKRCPSEWNGFVLLSFGCNVLIDLDDTLSFAQRMLKKKFKQIPAVHNSNSHSYSNKFTQYWPSLLVSDSWRSSACCGFFFFLVSYTTFVFRRSPSAEEVPPTDGTDGISAPVWIHQFITNLSSENKLVTCCYAANS